MRDDPRFPPVEMNGAATPWGTPQTFRPGPHRLPPGSQLPRVPGDTLVGAYDPNSVEGSALALERPERALPVPAPASVGIRDPHRYARVISLTAVAGNLQSNKFLDAPSGKRNFLAFRNSGAAITLFLDFGKDADANSTFVLAPGAVLLFDTVVPQDDVYLFGNGAAGVLSYSFSNIEGESIG